MTPAPRKDGDLYADATGKPVIFPRDYNGKAGVFVKRYNASALRWDMVPATKAQQGIAHARTPATVAPAPFEAVYARRNAEAHT